MTRSKWWCGWKYNRSFLLRPLPFQRFTDSNSPDLCLWLDAITNCLWTIEESCPYRTPPCCDLLKDLLPADLLKDYSHQLLYTANNCMHSSMVQRPIVIASNQRHKSGPLLSVYLWNGKGLERKVVAPRVKPKDSGLSCQCSATELWHTTATATPLSRHDSLKVIVWMNAVMLCSWCE